jgi:hypothetical protein
LISPRQGRNALARVMSGSWWQRKAKNVCYHGSLNLLTFNRPTNERIV